jgi:hypothetical protein
MRHGGSQLPTDVSRTALSGAFAALEPRLAEHRAERAALRRRTAPDFNVFDFIEPTENVLSDIMGFFLDPAASHGQGTLFLRTLIGLVRPDLEIDCQRPTLAREAQTYSIPQKQRRIDLLITLDAFILAIENKKFSGEGRNQIHDYIQHLQNIAGGRHCCLIFLNQTGTQATSIDREYAAKLSERRQLMSWSWERDIPSWLRECEHQCEAGKIRHFIEDFENYIAGYLAAQKQITNDDYDT